MMASDRDGFQRGFLLKKQNKKTLKNLSSSLKSGFLLDKEQKQKRNKANAEPSAKKVNSQMNDGFSRGFLLSTKKHTRKKRHSSRRENGGDPASEMEPKQKSSISHDLKELEEPSNGVPSNAFFILASSKSGGSKQRTSNRSPLISILSEDSEKPSAGTSSSTPLAEVLAPTEIRNAPNPSSVKKQSAEKVDDSFLQKLSSEGIECPSSLNPQTVHTSEICIQESPGQPCNVSRQKEPSWLKLQQESEANLWEGEKSFANEDDAIDTKSWTNGHVALTWERLLRMSCPQRHSKVVQSILFRHPNSIAPFLESRDQNHRVVALTMVGLLKWFLAELKQDEGSPVEWKVVVLGRLQTLWQPSRRTVLAQESWITGVLVLASIGDHITSQRPKPTESYGTLDFRSLLTTFQNLIQTKLSWLDTRRNSNKQQIEISILKDWGKVNELYQEDVDIRWWEQLCHHFGGLRQCFCDSRVSWNLLSEDVIALLDATSATMNDPNELEIRGILRGVLSSLATAKLTARECEEMSKLVVRLVTKCTCADTSDLLASLL